MQGDIFYLTKIRSRCELQKYLKIIQKSIIGGYAELLFIIPVLVYDTFTHASMDSVSNPIPLWQLRSLLPPIFFQCPSEIYYRFWLAACRSINPLRVLAKTELCSL